MIDTDKWQEIFFTLKQYKLRTSLTAFGVFWGIFMLVVLLGAGNGLERGAQAEFGGQLNSIFIWSSGKTQLPYRGMKIGRRMVLKDGDIDAIREKIPELGLIAGINDLNGWQIDLFITRKNKSGAFSVRGVEPSYFELSNLSILKGRSINRLDFEKRRKVAVIGTEVKDILFGPGEQVIGSRIKIQGVDFLVVGIYESLSQGQAAREDAERIILPNASQRHTFNQTEWIGYFQLRPGKGIHATVLEEKVKTLLMERHKIHPDDTGVIGSWNAQKEYERIQGLFNGIETFSWIVAIGTIIAGVIGVGNIMLIIVKERTREIGVRKALGATSYNIVSTIVQESLVLTIFAGYFGLVVGVFVLEGISMLIENMPNIMFGKADIDFPTAIIALLCLICAGALAAILPASKAVQVNPIVALQDE